jgi:hypothetical protein
MPNKPLQAVSLPAPGYFGLNTQDSPVLLNPSFATQAYNAVIDRYGRIGARKGWTYKTTTNGTSTNIKAMFEFDNNDNTFTIISAGNNKLFTGETTLTEKPVRNKANTADLTYTITANNWQIIQAQYQSGLTLSPHGFLLQKNHPALIYHKLPAPGTGATFSVTTVGGLGDITALSVTAAGSGYKVGDVLALVGGTGTGGIVTVATLTGTGIATVTITDPGTGYTALDALTSVVIATDDHGHGGSFGFQRLADVGSVPTGYNVSSFMPNCGLATAGRLWLADIGADPLTIYYSVLLEPDNFTGVGSGYINLEQVVPGGDRIVALAEHNNFLIVFCQNNIVLYNNANDIDNLTLSDVIKGVGCIARDSVQNIGTDLLFLSNAGMRSLGRVIQEKSSPMRDVSRNVRDQFLQTVYGQDMTTVRSVYFEKDALYLLALPAGKFVYCFDVRTPLEDGSFRTTIWSRIDPNTFLATRDRRLLLGKLNGIAEYTGYTDNGDQYVFSYYTPIIDFGDSSLTKFLKKIVVTVSGASNTTLDIRWAFDYNTKYNATQVTTMNAPVAEYGEAEYGVSEYAASVYIDQFSRPLSGSGNVVQLGVDAAINGQPMSLQKIDIYSVLGRTI